MGSPKLRRRRAVGADVASLRRSEDRSPRVLRLQEPQPGLVGRAARAFLRTGIDNSLGHRGLVSSASSSESSWVQWIRVSIAVPLISSLGMHLGHGGGQELGRDVVLDRVAPRDPHRGVPAVLLDRGAYSRLRDVESLTAHGAIRVDYYGEVPVDAWQRDELLDRGVSRRQVSQKASPVERDRVVHAFNE